MLASTTLVAVLGSLLSLAAAAPHRSPLFSFGKELAKRTSPSELETSSSWIGYPVVCEASCSIIPTVDNCYDQASCAPACAPGMYDQLADCFNCAAGNSDVDTDFDTVLEKLGEWNGLLGGYLEKCELLHYKPKSKTDHTPLAVTATPTGAGEPDTTSYNFTITKLSLDATVTITPIASSTASSVA